MSGKSMPTTPPAPPPGMGAPAPAAPIASQAAAAAAAALASAVGSPAAVLSPRTASSGSGGGIGSLSPQQPQQQAPPTSSSPQAAGLLASASITNLSTFQSLLHSTAHYGSDLWDAIPAVAAQSEGSKAVLTRMARFLKDKAELDKEYAKSLKKLVVKLAIPDVPRVADIPMPPQAAAQAAAQAAKEVMSGATASTGVASMGASAQPGASSGGAAAAAAAGGDQPSSSNVASVPSASQQQSQSSQFASGASPAPASSSSSASAPTQVDPRSFDRFLMAFRNLHLTLSTNLEILSAKITEQVAKPLAAQRDAHASVQRKLVLELDKYTANYQRHLDTLLASRAACQKACQESEAMRRKLEHAQQAAGGGGGGEGGSSSVVNDLVNAFKADSASLSRRALVADAKYVAAVKAMRGFRMASDATLAHLLDQFEALEGQKVSAVRSGLSHYLGIHQSMFSSNSKNMASVSAVEARVNPQADTAFFILSHRSGKLPIALPEYQVLRGHPNYSRAVEEEEAANMGIVVGAAQHANAISMAMGAAGVQGAVGGHAGAQGGAGDMSSFSSSQMDALALAEAEASSGGGAGGSGSGFGSLLPSMPQAKKSGWGWLNSLAAVLPGAKPSHRSMSGIDHDAEAALTRAGSASYDAGGSGAHDGSEGPDSFSSSASPPAPGAAGSGAAVPRKATWSFNGDLEGADDHLLEEKTPERVDAEQELADMFDAVTGRVVPTNAFSAAAAAAGAAAVTPSPGAIVSPPPVSSGSGASGNGGHEAVTYSLSRSRDLTPAELSRSTALFATPDGRKAFASVLNRQRNTSGGLRLPSRTVLNRLAQWTMLFLDGAMPVMHVTPTQLVMIMSQSFYVEEDEQGAQAESAAGAQSRTAAAAASDNSNNGDDADESGLARSSSTVAPSRHSERVYLLSLVRPHPLWRDLRYWTESFFAAYNSKIRRSSAARVHKWHSDAEQAEGLHTRKQVCFSTLSTFAHNMIEFGMAASAVVGFVEKIASINELDDEQQEMLRGMAAFETHRKDQAQARRNSDARIEPIRGRERERQVEPDEDEEVGGRARGAEAGSPSSASSGARALGVRSYSSFSSGSDDEDGSGGLDSRASSRTTSSNVAAMMELAAQGANMSSRVASAEDLDALDAQTTEL